MDNLLRQSETDVTRGLAVIYSRKVLRKHILDYGPSLLPPQDVSYIIYSSLGQHRLLLGSMVLLFLLDAWKP